MPEGFNKFHTPSLGKIENQLSQLLQPVKPDLDFVNTLKTKLVQMPTIVVESTKKGSKFLVWVLGILAGVVAIWILGRTKNSSSKQKTR